MAALAKGHRRKCCKEGLPPEQAQVDWTAVKNQTFMNLLKDLFQETIINDFNTPPPLFKHLK